MKNMNTRLAAKVSVMELWDFFQIKIKNKWGNNYNPCLFEIVSNIGKIKKDISKVNFNFENSYFQASDNWGDFKFGPMQIGDFSYIGCMAGGDWEFPVYFIIYLDKDKKTFRGYVPVKGNPWNHNTKKAFGNDEEADNNFLKKWIKKNFPDFFDNNLKYNMDDADLMYNKEMIIMDITNRIHVFL